MPNLPEHAALAADDAFRRRVQAAAVQAAMQISGEAVPANDAGQHALRGALAAAVLGGTLPDGLVWAAAANSTVLDAYKAQSRSIDVSDSDIEYVLTTVWDDVSGAARIVP